MDITFDPAKDATNLKKHGVSLARAADMAWSETRVTADERHEYGEERWIGLGPIGDRLYTVVFVIRDDVIRVVSLRKSNSREVKRYEQ